MSVILNLTWAVVLLPLVGVGAAFLSETPRRATQLGVAFTGLAFAASLVVLLFRLTHTIPGYENLQTFWDLPGASTTTPKGTVFPTDMLLTWGIRVDPLSASFMALVLFLSLVAQLHALGSVRGEDGFRRFFWITGVLTFGMLAMISSPNLFQFLIGWEVVAVAVWMLGAHAWRRAGVAAAATRSFVTLRVADAVLLLGVAFTFGKFAVRLSQGSAPPGLPAGDPLSFTGLAPVWHLAHIGAVGGVGGRTLVALAMLFLVAAAVRAGVGPAHLWLSGAVDAPAAGLALIGIAAPLSAALLLARVYPLFIEATTMLSVLALVGAVTAVAGAVLALAQRDLLRVGVFAVSSQAGLVLATLGMGGFSPALFMVFTGSVLTVLFFLAAANIAHGYRTRDLTEMGGAWRSMRRSSMGLLVWALGVSGLSLNTYSVVSATFRNAVPLGGASSRPVQIVVGVAALLTVGLTAVYALRAFLLAAGGTAVRRRGFEVTRVRDVAPHAVGTVRVLIAAAVVATLIGIPGVSAFRVGGARVAGLTFSHFVFYGGVRQQLALDFVALALVIIVGLAGAAIAWSMYSPAPRPAGLRMRARLASLGGWLGQATAAERLSVPVPSLLVGAGATLERVDVTLLDPLLDGPGETVDAAAGLIGRFRGGRPGASVTAAFAVVAVLLAACALAVTGHFPVGIR